MNNVSLIAFVAHMSWLLIAYCTQCITWQYCWIVCLHLCRWNVEVILARNSWLSSDTGDHPGWYR